MTLLEHLPNEIWAEILSNLGSCHLASPCLVSRRMSSIAYPILYKEPHLEGDNNPNTLHLFLRTLLAPGGDNLARHVRALNISWDDDTGPAGDDPDGDCFSAALARFGFPNYVLTGSVQVMLLLHLVPQLEVLDIFPRDETEQFDDFMDTLHALQPVASLPVGLQSLRDFAWVPDMFPGTVSASTILTLLNLPNIRSIDIHLFHGLRLYSENAALASAPKSSVKKLTFRTARVCNTSLNHLLAIPRELTHFTYYSRSVDASFDFASFGRAIRQHRRTIVTLVLDFVYRRGPRSQSTCIGSLHDWHALKSLTCTSLPLFGTRRPVARGLADVLPGGLRELEIARDNFWRREQVVKQVVLLLREKDVVVPGLQSVVVNALFAASVEVQEELRAAGEAAGVKVAEYRWILDE